MKLLLLLVLCSTALCLVFHFTQRIKGVNIDHDDLPHPSVNGIVPVKRAVNYGGYVVNIAMTGQQGSNVKILMAQQCFFGAVGNVSVVEPFYRNNKFYGEPGQRKLLDTQLRFRNFFNVQKHNEIAKEQHFAQLVSWEDFLSNAPREVVYIDLPESRRPECDTDRFVYLLQKSHCSDKEVQKIHFLQQYNFTVVKTVYTYKSFENLKKGTTSWPLDNITLVFNGARPRLFKHSNIHNNSCVEVFYSNPHIQLISSQQILHQVDLYESHFLHGVNRLAVVIRLEHILEGIGRQRKRKQQRYHAIETCLKVTARISILLSTNSRPFVATDYSHYTSSSWMRTKSVHQDTDKQMISAELRGRRVVEGVFQGLWEFDKWASSFSEVTEGIDDPGYVAALQRTIAGRAKCLVLVGGGDFQYLILQQYMHNLPHESQLCVHLVCIPEFLHYNLQLLLKAFRLRCVWESSFCTLHKY